MRPSVRGAGWTLIIPLAILISSCKSTQTISTPKPSPPSDDIIKPAWVLQKPTIPGYYIGIGNAPLTDPDYLSNAKLEALDDLASEISVRVESSSLLSQVETSAGFSELFQSAIRQTTDQSLELHKQTASWSSDRYYWVQYRLNKADYDDLRKQQKQETLEVATSHFRKGEDAMEKGDLVQSLHFYAQCMETLNGYLNQKNEALIDGKTVPIDLESFSRILHTVTNLTFQTEANPVEFSPNVETKSIEITALSDSRPVKNLPLHVVLGDTLKRFTDEQGIVTMEVNRKLANQKLTFTPDFQLLERFPLIWKLIHGLKPKPLIVSLHAPPIEIELASDERNLDKSVNNPRLIHLMKKIITSQGYAVVDDNGEYTLTVSSNTREGGELSGLYTTYLDVNIKIIDNNGKTVFSDTFTNIKGIHTSYPQAGLKAYQNASDDFSGKIKSSIQKNFIGKD